MNSQEHAGNRRSESRIYEFYEHMVEWGLKMRVYGENYTNFYDLMQDLQAHPWRDEHELGRGGNGKRTGGSA